MVILEGNKWSFWSRPISPVLIFLAILPLAGPPVVRAIHKPKSNIPPVVEE